MKENVSVIDRLKNSRNENVFVDFIKRNNMIMVEVVVLEIIGYLGKNGY